MIFLAFPLISCQSGEDGETLAQLRHVKIELKEAELEGGLEKAIQSYQHFLEVTPEAAMTPEAIRRLADLKIEKEYGVSVPAAAQPSQEAVGKTAKNIDAPVRQGPKAASATAGAVKVAATEQSESEREFEKRATVAQIPETPEGTAIALPEGAEDLQRADALEAIALYQKLLEKYPLYERNDQVLYQMARAHEELGEVDEAMNVMNRLVREFPRSRYVDEVQFRRGEYFFMRKKYLDAEDAYGGIEKIGVGSSYYELALYKLGWTLYKQELYEDALHRFVALLDHKVAAGVDFESITDDIEKKRIEDTYRVISFSFSYLGGSEATNEYFAKYGRRRYENSIYANLGEHYLEKRRYADAAGSYKAFVKLYPFHKDSPRFDMRVIDIYKDGGFPQLVIESNKTFAKAYGLKSEYWHHFDVNAYPEVLGYLKKNLKELANHYHALYQDKRFEKEQEPHFQEALTWYREYLDSFPKDADTPPINYQLADLLLERKAFDRAAVEYERTAYGYAPHDQASAAGYAAVYAYRQHLIQATGAGKESARREVIRSSLRMVDTFPGHEKASVVLGAAADDMYEMKDYALAETAGRRLIEHYPGAERTVLRSAWLVVAHASFDQSKYPAAEVGYTQVLGLTAEQDASREGLTENLAASIYKQGEQAAAAEDFRAAADHFLRIGNHAPTAKIRPTAEYDGAAALIQLKAWDEAAVVLQTFRKRYPGHALQPEATKKIALVYKEAGKLALAAEEYERIETESTDEEMRRGALLLAAELYEQAGHPQRALQVYTRYVAYFPRPLESALEARFKAASIYLTLKDKTSYHKELSQIVEADARAGKERTDRTRYLGATSALVLAEPEYEQLVEIKLVKPFEKNLKRKKAAMKRALDTFGKLTHYEVGEVTAAATFYMGEIYYHFSRSLMESERPTDLSALELEEYELAIEEQAYPFEEKAINVHQKNLELLTMGVYNQWIDRTFTKLAALMPARYARDEDSGGFMPTSASFSYSILRQGAVESAAAAVTPEAAGEAR